MDLVTLGVVVLGGAFVWINKDQLLHPGGNGDGITDCVKYPDSPGCSGTGSGGDCKQLCSDGDCEGYEANCTKGCSKCGSGGSDGGSGGDSDCKRWCSERKCESYNRNCDKGCSACSSGGGGGDGGGDGGGGGCNINCRSGYTRDTSNGQCRCRCTRSGGCTDSGGGSGCSKAGQTCGALGWTWKTGSNGGCVCTGYTRSIFEDLVYPYQVAVSARFEDLI